MLSRLVIVLPGGGYGPQGPALRFPVLALEQRGFCESMVVTYPSIPVGTTDTGTLLTDAIAEQVLPTLHGTSADEVVFVAKSLGTRALAGLCSRMPSDRSMAALWLTPLFEVPEVRDRAAASDIRSLIVAGSADPYHDQFGFDSVAAALDASTLLVPDADHALEIPGDVQATIRAMESLSRAVLEFTARRHPV